MRFASLLGTAGRRGPGGPGPRGRVREHAVGDGPCRPAAAAAGPGPQLPARRSAARAAAAGRAGRPSRVPVRAVVRASGRRRWKSSRRRSMPAPGHYEVVLLNPETCCPVKVCFTLPCGCPEGQGAREVAGVLLRTFRQRRHPLPPRRQRDGAGLRTSRRDRGRDRKGAGQVPDLAPLPYVFRFSHPASYRRRLSGLSGSFVRP